MNMRTQLTRWCSAGLLTAALATSGAGCASDGVTVNRNGQNPNAVLNTRGIDPQDFKIAAQELTTQMLANPEVQRAFQSIDPQSGKPLVKISRFRNDTTLKINMVDYLATPVKNTLVNSGKARAFAEDQLAQDTAAGRDILSGTSSAKLPDFILYGVVSRLSTSEGDRAQNYYLFQMSLVDPEGTEVWSDRQDVSKGFRGRPGVGF